MMLVKIFALILYSLVQIQRSYSVAIDNDIADDPIIECMDDKIRFWVKTRKYFAGRVYAKGRADNVACIRADFAQLKTREPHFDMSFGYCGMQTLRSLDPRGMFYSITVMVSFHPLFITKVDKAFHVKCFFEEASAGLTAEIGVSMVPTTEVTAAHTVPGCRYSIHRSTIAELDGGYDAGPAIQFARVGDKVLHRWQCDDPMFGILINNCYVTDGFGQRADVVDYKGCPVDPILITGIRYAADLTTAYAESHVFKFADKPGVWFFCKLQMCMQGAGMCHGITPPSCASTAPSSGGGYGAPAPSYPPPAPGYGAPAPSYPSPDPSYPAPASSSHGPAPGYPAPAPSYPAPAPSYPAPAPSYPAPAPSYPAPAPSYGAAPPPDPAPAPYPQSPYGSPSPAPSYGQPSATPKAEGYPSVAPLHYTPPTYNPYKHNPPPAQYGGYTIETGPVHAVPTPAYPYPPLPDPPPRSPYGNEGPDPAHPKEIDRNSYYDGPIRAIEVKLPGATIGEVTVIYDTSGDIPLVFDDGDVSGVSFMDHGQQENKQHPLKQDKNFKDRRRFRERQRPSFDDHEVDFKPAFREHEFRFHAPNFFDDEILQATGDDADYLLSKDAATPNPTTPKTPNLSNFDMYRTAPPDLPKPRIRIYPPANLPGFRSKEKVKEKKRPDPQPKLFFNRLTHEALKEHSGKFEKSYRFDDAEKLVASENLRMYDASSGHENLVSADSEPNPEPNPEPEAANIRGINTNNIDYEAAEFDTSLNPDNTELMGQLIVYDIDEDPPASLQTRGNDAGLGPNIVEENADNSTSGGSAQSACIITSEGLLTLLSLSGSLTGLLSFILFVTCIRLQRNDKMSRLHAAYGHKLRDINALEQMTMRFKTNRSKSGDKKCQQKDKTLYR